jgi:predicted molibdopterin-dependent oxidoreductase YjgC
MRNSQARPEWQALCQIAQKMNVGGFDFSGPSEVMDEIAGITPMYQGVSFRRLEGQAILVSRPDPSNPLPTQLLYSDKEYRGIQWPCPTEAHGGTPILYSDGFPGGKARLAAPDFRAGELPTTTEYPLMYVPGRVLLQSEREIEVVRGQLNRIKRNELVEMNPEDAGTLGIAEGDPVEVLTPALSFQGRATIREAAQRGIVSSTGLFGQLAVELQASQEPDPMSGVPGLVITPATVVKASPS